MYSAGGCTEFVVEEVENGAKKGAKGWFPVGASKTERESLTNKNIRAGNMAARRDKLVAYLTIERAY